MDITSRKIPENNFILIHQKKLKNVKYIQKVKSVLLKRKSKLLSHSIWRIYKEYDIILKRYLENIFF